MAITTRIDHDRLDTIHDDLTRTVDTIMAALRAGGYEPIIDLDTIETTGPDATTGKHGASDGLTPGRGVLRLLEANICSILPRRSRRSGSTSTTRPWW